jgi:ferredoxin/flavodoxin---NADP+ reductase
MATLMRETVTSVVHWTERLFSFRTTRASGFRFKNGYFTMIGIENEGKPLLRAYSMVSANHEEELEFFSIKVPEGPLTSRLQHIRPGDELLINSKATGTLVLDNLLPGRHLYLLGTGTGLAPFLSIIKDPEIYENFDRVILVHGCRLVQDLAYREYLTETLPGHEYLGELVQDKLRYYPTVTREAFVNTGRITTLLESGKLANDLALPEINPDRDRFMLCGSPSMLKDIGRLLEARGFDEARHGNPGHFVVERAFVET